MPPLLLLHSMTHERRTKSMWMMRSKKNLQRGSKQQTSVPNAKRAKWNRSNWTKRQTDRRTDTQWERQAQVCLHKMTASTERMKTMTTKTDDSSRPDSGQNWQTTATKTSVMTRAKRQFKFCMKGKTEKNRLEWNRMELTNEQKQCYECILFRIL